MPTQYVGSRSGPGGREARYLNVNVTAADTELVAAATGKKHVVHGICITGDAGGIVSFVSDGSSDTEIASFRLTALTAAGWLGPILLPVTDAGWFETLSGEALDLRLATTANADGVVVYSTVDADSV